MIYKECVKAVEFIFFPCDAKFSYFCTSSIFDLFYGIFRGKNGGKIEIFASFVKRGLKVVKNKLDLLSTCNFLDPLVQ